jgi:hypothetical protein
MTKMGHFVIQEDNNNEQKARDSVSLAIKKLMTIRQNLQSA